VARQKKVRMDAMKLRFRKIKKHSKNWIVGQGEKKAWGSDAISTLGRSVNAHGRKRGRGPVFPLGGNGVELLRQERLARRCRRQGVPKLGLPQVGQRPRKF